MECDGSIAPFATFNVDPAACRLLQSRMVQPMSTSAPIPPSTPETCSRSEQSSPRDTWRGRLVEKYRRDHQHPINHALHVGVGWPMVGASLLLLPFRPLWSLGLFLGGYAFMFSGHFLFEKNLPTILKHPSTPFVMAWAVTQGLLARIGLGNAVGVVPSETESKR